MWTCMGTEPLRRLRAVIAARLPRSSCMIASRDQLDCFSTFNYNSSNVDVDVHCFIFKHGTTVTSPSHKSIIRSSTSMAPHNGLSSVPDHIPGMLVEQPEHRHMLRTHLAQMTDQSTLRSAERSCCYPVAALKAEAFRTTCRFPGSQPVSFDYRTLDLLMQEE